MDISRRNFLKVSAVPASFGLFNIVPASVFGARAPSNRIVLGMVGLGAMGRHNMKSFLELDDVVIKAVCDVNTARMDKEKQRVDGHYKNHDCEKIRDFREVCQRKDIDAVTVATPDHWHAYVSTYAVRHGKDVYGEKPFTHDLREGQELIRAVRRYGRVWQTGSWQRSNSEMRRAVELVRNGRIGKVARVIVGLPAGRAARYRPNLNAKVPATLDWNFWLGPAPWRPFQGIYDWDWRWVLDWGGGQVMDWIGHHGDIAQWGLGRDLSGPVSFEGKGDFSHPFGPYDSPVGYRITCVYDDGVELTVADSRKVGMGIKWIGENGKWIWTDRGRFQASDPSIRSSRIEAGEERVYFSPGHHRNFIDCVRNRKTTVTPAEIAHRSASIGHLCQIAMLTGRKISWDPEREAILGDPQASAMLGRVPRGEWSLV